MKLLITTLLMVFTISSIQAQLIKNNMWAADKQMHFEAGAMIGSLTYAVVAETTNSKKKAFLYSMLATSMAGLAKELVDTQPGGSGFDSGELGATALGGLTVGMTFEIFNKKKRQDFIVSR